MANIHSIMVIPSLWLDTCQWIVLRVSLRYTRCRPTHPISVQWWARVAAYCWFNAGQLCTTLALHHSNTDWTHDPSAPASTAMTGRLTNVASMLIQRVWRWPNNNTAFCIHRLLRSNCYIGGTISSPVVRKATTQIHWPNCEIILGHSLRRWANIIPPLL